jgi:hypothetical protein
MYFAADEMSEADAPAASPTLSWGHVQIMLPTMVTPAPTICRGVKRLPKMKDDKRIVQARLDWEKTWEKFGRVGESKLAGQLRGQGALRAAAIGEMPGAVAAGPDMAK